MNQMNQMNKMNPLIDCIYRKVIFYQNDLNEQNE